MHGAIVKAVKTRDAGGEGAAGDPAGGEGRLLLRLGSGEQLAQRGERLFADAEVGPAAALLALDQPGLSSTFRWWLTVGWLRPSGSVRWQTQASWPGWAWIRLSSRSRAGSAITLSARGELLGVLGARAAPAGAAGRRRRSSRSSARDPY